MLSERGKLVLHAIVAQYIQTVAPVGSHAISKEFGVSPATIRSIMAELENYGLLTHPHVSAGRIPTEKGFRLYADDMLDELIPDIPSSIIPPQWLNEFISREEKNNPIDIMPDVSKLLSRVTRYMSIVIQSRVPKCLLKYIKFILLRNRTVMSILVSKEGMVFEKILPINEDITQAELDKISKFLNETYENQSIDAIRNKLSSEIRAEREQYDKTMARILSLGGSSLFAASNKLMELDTLFVEGAINMFDQPEFASADKMKAILRKLDEKDNIVKVLDKLVVPGEVRVFVGSESSFIGQDDCCFIVSGYSLHEGYRGIIGILGPMRMQYREVIPIVNCTTNLISRLICHIC